jgi:hypothetical protein
VTILKLVKPLHIAYDEMFSTYPGENRSLLYKWEKLIKASIGLYLVTDLYASANGGPWVGSSTSYKQGFTTICRVFFFHMKSSYRFPEVGNIIIHVDWNFILDVLECPQQLLVQFL